MKLRFAFFVGILMASTIVLFISCEKETTNKKSNTIYILPETASSVAESKILLYSTTPYEFPLSVGILSALNENVDVSLNIDNSLVAPYNTAQKTNYAVMPEGSYSLASNSLSIPGDSIVSQQTKLFIKADMLESDVPYLLPVKIETVSNKNIVLNGAIATKYFIIRVPTPVIGNLSDGKNSYWKDPSASWEPQRGNDGNTNGDWGGGSVCESGAGNEQYWEVDLGGISPRIDTVRIWNRTDCCDDRTAKFYVFISNVPFSGKSVQSSLDQPGVYKYYSPDKAGRPTEIYPKVSGRYIRIQNTTGASLTLAELTAIGIKP